MKVALRDLGSMDYKTCWDLQQTLFDALVAGKSGGKCPGPDIMGAAQVSDKTGTAEGGAQGSATTATAEGDTQESGATDTAEAAGTILLVEHPPVYTLGKSGHAENLLVDRQALEAMGAQFFHIDRGGDITFHGPGQLVCYPILNLERLGIGLREYIDALEEAVIRTVERYGITAGRIAGASGVWIGSGEHSHVGVPRKICAIGVRSSRYITMHGFALNVSTDLRWFSRINPCGFTDRGVTSIAAETKSLPSMQEVKRTVVEMLGRVLQCEIVTAP